MPCQHLNEIQELKLPISNSDVLKVLCPICGRVEVCAYTAMSNEALDDQEDCRVAGGEEDVNMERIDDSQRPASKCAQ